MTVQPKENAAMTALLITLAALSIAAVAGTAVLTVRDGYGRVPALFQR
ncbi:hypothetical protein OVN20_13050 [Microcella daejeonensis]|nr:hypothetical protein [Microcella daejeonensis]WAB83938.1 hypothetical protein OVN20_13050 [Microcella daejeonensis]